MPAAPRRQLTIPLSVKNARSSPARPLRTNTTCSVMRRARVIARGLGPPAGNGSAAYFGRTTVPPYPG